MKYIETLNKDARLKKAIQYYGRIDLENNRNPNVFARLCRSILGQQVSVKAAESIFNKFLLLCESDIESLSPSTVLNFKPEELRPAGLSRSKAASVLDLAEKMNQGLVPEYTVLCKMTPEDIVGTLIQVRGIGPWTAEMFLMFTLAHEDTISTGDLGLMKGFSILYDLDKLPSPDEFSSKAELWRPYRTYACMYLWKICHDGKKMW